MIYLLIIILSVAILVKLNRAKKGGCEYQPPKKPKEKPPDTTDRLKNIDDTLCHINDMLEYEIEPRKTLQLLKEKNKLLKEKEKITNDSKN